MTAKHVVEGAVKESIDGKIHLKVNRKDGSATWVEISTGDWLTHPLDNSVDVAVLPFELPTGIDHLSCPTYGFATKEVIVRESIGLGDELFFIGAFTGHLETKRNIPIVRIGNIAAMPEEPVDTKMYGKIEAYLVEARSIGGLSGSPVFVHLGGIRNVRESVLAQGNKFYLIGLIHGHWKKERTRDVDLKLVEPIEEVNEGIAIAVPSTNIMEVLDQPRLMEARRVKEESAKARNLPTPDFLV